MRYIRTLFICTALALGVFVLPLSSTRYTLYVTSAHAQETVKQPKGPQDLKCEANSNNCLKNPIPQTNFLMDLIFRFMLIFRNLVFTFCVIMVVLGGYRMIASIGNQEMYTSGKNTIKWAIIGFLAMLLAYNMVAVVRNFFGG